MRPLTYQDVVAAARVLSRLPSELRGPELELMLDEAGTADRFRKRCGRWHSMYGNGSLEAAARLRPIGPTLKFDDPENLACLSQVFDRLAGLRRCSSQVTRMP